MKIKNILDIFYPQEKFNKKANTYLDRFLKKYDARTASENILVECLYNLEFLNLQDRRFLGAAEAVLLMETNIKNNTDFEYIVKKDKFLYLTFSTKETYREHIIRLIKEYLTEKGVM